MAAYRRAAHAREQDARSNAHPHSRPRPSPRLASRSGLSPRPSSARRRRSCARRRSRASSRAPRVRPAPPRASKCVSEQSRCTMERALVAGLERRWEEMRHARAASLLLPTPRVLTCACTLRAHLAQLVAHAQQRAPQQVGHAAALRRRVVEHERHPLPEEGRGRGALAQ